MLRQLVQKKGTSKWLVKARDMKNAQNLSKQGGIHVMARRAKSHCIDGRLFSLRRLDDYNM
jgi:hypothetical protein